MISSGISHVTQTLRGQLYRFVNNSSCCYVTITTGADFGFEVPGQSSNGCSIFLFLIFYCSTYVLGAIQIRDDDDDDDDVRADRWKNHSSCI